MSSLFEPSATKLSAPLQTIEFDSTPSETYTGQTNPTDHPVETGATVSDHAIDQPFEIELRGIVTARPIVIDAETAANPSVTSGGNRLTRVEDAYRELERLRKSKILVTVATALGDFVDFLITSTAVTREPGSGTILDVAVRLREFRRATVETVEAPEPTDSVDAPEVDLGPKTPSPSSPSTADASDEAGVAVKGANALEALRGSLLSGLP